VEPVIASKCHCGLQWTMPLRSVVPMFRPSVDVDCALAYLHAGLTTAKPETLWKPLPVAVAVNCDIASPEAPMRVAVLSRNPFDAPWNAKLLASCCTSVPSAPTALAK